MKRWRVYLTRSVGLVGVKTLAVFLWLLTALGYYLLTQSVTESVALATVSVFGGMLGGWLVTP